jgi:hypothetical protein
MPKGAAISAGSSGEIISHFGAIRMRITGTGNLQMRLISLDSIRSTTLVPFSMDATTNKVPTRLCNFVDFRAQLEGKTTEIGESFRINRIVFFIKELYSEEPNAV